jgi:hypothetical protein
MFSSQSNIRRHWPFAVQETLRLQLAHDYCWRPFIEMANKNVWPTWPPWPPWPTRQNQPFFACGSRRRRQFAPPGIDLPPTSGILMPYLRCETGGQPPRRRRIIRFRCRGPAASLSRAETSFASGFLPSTTTDFLAPRGNCVHHADCRLNETRSKISLSPDRFSCSPHVSNHPSRPSFCYECGRGIRSSSAHAVRRVNVRSTRTEMKREK